jgi:hypothetical protein
MRSTVILLFAALIAGAAPVPAVAGVTPIQANPQKPFKHKPSGIVIDAAAAGIPRVSVEQFDDKQLDFAAEYRTADNHEITTVFIFRKVSGDVPLWFDRIQRVIEGRDVLASPTTAIPVAAFTPAGQPNARALRAVYAAGAPPFKSSAAALTTTGDWYVAVRASSQTLTPEQLLARVEQTFAGIKWPREKVGAPDAVPIGDCAVPLKEPAQDAKPAREDLAAILLNATAASVDKETLKAIQSQPQRWCRDAMKLPTAGVYRPDGASDRYLIAFQDAGRGMWVAPNAMAGLLTKSKGHEELTYMVELIDIDRHIGFGSFETMPGPAQTLWLQEHGTRKYSASTWGKGSNIEIDSDAVK